MISLDRVLGLVLRWRPSLRVITRENNQRYLERWALRRQARDGTNRWRIYLHHFLTGDGDGHHNHPWRWSFSLVLRGSYIEERFVPGGCEVKRRVRWFNWLGSNDYHRIVELEGDVWTLFFCGPLSGKSWGFWMPGRGHVAWKTRLAERGLTS